MTDEERQKLVADLREFTGLDNEPWLVRVGREAANEIERLAALVDDYKLVFGDIHKTELAELKARIEAYDRGEYD